METLSELYFISFLRSPSGRKAEGLPPKSSLRPAHVQPQMQTQAMGTAADAGTSKGTTAGTGAPMPIPMPPLFRRTAESAPPPDLKKSFSILLSVNSNVIATFDIVLTHFICCTGPTPFVFIYRRKHGSYRRKRSSYRWERSSAPFNGSTPLTL